MKNNNTIADPNELLKQEKNEPEKETKRSVRKRVENKVESGDNVIKLYNSHWKKYTFVRSQEQAKELLKKPHIRKDK